MAAIMCRCVWRGERCPNAATQEDGLCDWCARIGARSPEQLARNPKALIGPDGEYLGLGGGGELHDTAEAKPASTPACWYDDSDRELASHSSHDRGAWEPGTDPAEQCMCSHPRSEHRLTCPCGCNAFHARPDSGRSDLPRWKNEVG